MNHIRNQMDRHDYMKHKGVQNVTVCWVTKCATEQTTKWDLCWIRKCNRDYKVRNGVLKTAIDITTCDLIKRFYGTIFHKKLKIPQHN